jgi:hypothetical protein
MTTSFILAAQKEFKKIKKLTREAEQAKMAAESETKAQAHVENMKRIEQKLARISGVEIPEEKPKEVKDATKKRQRTKSNQQQHKNPKKRKKATKASSGNSASNS